LALCDVRFRVQRLAFLERLLDLEGINRVRIKAARAPFEHVGVGFVLWIRQRRQELLIAEWTTYVLGWAPSDSLEQDRIGQIVTNIDPDPAGDGLARGEHRNRRVVPVHALDGHDLSADPLIKRAQQPPYSCPLNRGASRRQDRCPRGHSARFMRPVRGRHFFSWEAAFQPADLI
jgi:hypothetical protein